MHRSYRTETPVRGMPQVRTTVHSQFRIELKRERCAMIRVIDIETTGIEPATSEIIEIARVDMVRGGGITNAMDTLVRPANPIPPGASAIHHIVDEDVKDAPSLGDVAHRFKGADFYVAHNCEFEQSFLQPRASSLAPGSARTNARFASGRSWTATAIKSCATRSAAPALSLALSAARSRRTAPLSTSSSPPQSLRS